MSRSGDPGDVLPEAGLEAVGVGTYRWDDDDGTLRLDARARRLLGLGAGSSGPVTRAEALARLHPDDVGRLEEALAETLATGRTVETLYRVVRPDGSARWLADRCGPVLGGRDDLGGADGGTGRTGRAGRPGRRVAGVLQEASGRRGEDARLARIVESVPTAFFFVDHDWCIAYVNAEAERLMGHPRAELLRTVVWDALPTELRRLVEAECREAVRTVEPRSFEIPSPPPADAWYEVSALPGPDGLAVFFLDVTERRREQQRADLLSAVTAELAGTMDAEPAVARLAGLVVPALADWCLVTLVDDDARTGGRRGLRDVAGWHADPAARPLVQRYAEVRLDALRSGSFFGRAVDSGEEVALDAGATEAVCAVLEPGEARDLLTRLAPESFRVLPLRGRGGVVGLITLFRAPERAPLGGRDRQTAREVAARAGQALEGSRLYRQQRNLAEGLQRALLTEPPQPPATRVAVRYVPSAQAAQVGGDWYDAFDQGAGATALVIGDVVGHDTAAAAAMGQLRSVLRGIAVTTGAGPAELLARADRAMRTLGATTLATAVVARLDGPAERDGRGAGRLRWSNAGHPPPLVVGADGTVSALESPAGAQPLLGVVPDVSRAEDEVVLEPGAMLLLYTDGLIERRDRSLDVGVAELRDAVAELVAQGADLDALCDGVLARMVPPQHEDDVALLAVRVGGPGEPDPRGTPDPGADADPGRPS